ncbi:MAG: hypothetical protein AABY83_14540 [Pseudomonadota bacterium]
MYFAYNQIILKHHRDLTWDDLAHIEAPMFAEAKLRHAGYGQGIPWYESVLRHSPRGASSFSGVGYQRMTEQQLRDALHHGEYVVLVKQPFQSPLRWHADTAHPLGGEWRLAQPRSTGLFHLTWAIKWLEQQRHYALRKNNKVAEAVEPETRRPRPPPEEKAPVKTNAFSFS